MSISAADEDLCLLGNAVWIKLSHRLGQHLSHIGLGRDSRLAEKLECRQQRRLWMAFIHRCGMVLLGKLEPCLGAGQRQMKKARFLKSELAKQAYLSATGSKRSAPRTISVMP